MGFIVEHVSFAFQVRLTLRDLLVSAPCCVLFLTQILTSQQLRKVAACTTRFHYPWRGITYTSTTTTATATSTITDTVRIGMSRSGATGIRTDW